jgi:hypothetical protein
MALMNNNPMEIMPEQYYFDKVKPLLDEMFGKIKFDPVLVSTIEEVINKANAHAVHKEYEEFVEDFNPLTMVLLDSKSQYLKTKIYTTASAEEKTLVEKLSNEIQQLITICKFSKTEKIDKKEKVRPRLGYDEDLKQNIVSPDELQTGKRVEQQKRKF